MSPLSKRMAEALETSSKAALESGRDRLQSTCVGLVAALAVLAKHVEALEAQLAEHKGGAA